MDEQLMLTARQACERDALFRRSVDQAVHETMRHFEHVESEVDKRDIVHAATLSAMAVLRLTIDGDRHLKAMEFERDAAKRQLEKMVKTAPFPTYYVGGSDRP